MHQQPARCRCLGKLARKKIKNLSKYPGQYALDIHVARPCLIRAGIYYTLLNVCNFNAMENFLLLLKEGERG
jgi:hypothetical protein